MKRSGMKTIARRRTMRKFGGKRRGRIPKGTRAIGIRRWAGSMISGIHTFPRTVNLALAATGDFVVAGQLSKMGSTIQYTIPAASAYTTNYGTFAFTPTLSYLPSVTEFTALFDEYRIDKVIVNIVPFQNSYSAESTAGGAQTSGSCPILHLITDSDGYTPINSEAGVAELQQYPSYRKILLNNPYSFSFTPYSRSVVQTGGGTSVASKTLRNTWLDCGTTDIVHYGSYGIVESIAPNAQLQLMFFRVEATYIVEFKGVR